MSDLALRPRSATELVDAAFQVFRRDPVHFLVATALVYVPWLVVRLLSGIGLSGIPSFRQVVWTAVAGLAVYALVSGAMTLVSRAIYFEQPVDLRDVFRTVGGRLPTLILTTAITFALIVFAAIFLFFPALYPLARFFAVRQAVMLEDAGVGRSLARSSELSKGTKWHILGTLLLVGVVTVAINVGMVFMLNFIKSQVLLAVISTAVSIVLYPFFGITETLLYYDIRIRKEGFDIEYLAGTGRIAEAPGATL